MTQKIKVKVKVSYDAIYTDGVDDGGIGIHARHTSVYTFTTADTPSLWDLRQWITEDLKRKHEGEEGFCTVTINHIQSTQE